MKFTEAFKMMKQGAKVKLPSWGGHWYWDPEKETIMIQCRQQDGDQGELLDIRETQRVEYTTMNLLSDEWIVADEKNCPVLGGEATFSFGEAIKYLKRGMKVKRKGWNGKNQYIQLATEISYKTAEGDVVNCEQMLSEMRLLHFAELLVCRWDGLRLRLICWQRLGICGGMKNMKKKMWQCC